MVARDNGRGEAVTAGKVTVAALMEAQAPLLPVAAMEASVTEAVAVASEGKAWGMAEGVGWVMEMGVGMVENGGGEVVEALEVAWAVLVAMAAAMGAVTVGVIAVPSKNPEISS